LSPVSGVEASESMLPPGGSHAHFIIYRETTVIAESPSWCLKYSNTTRASKGASKQPPTLLMLGKLRIIRRNHPNGTAPASACSHLRRAHPVDDQKRKNVRKKEEIFTWRTSWSWSQPSGATAPRGSGWKIRGANAGYPTHGLATNNAATANDMVRPRVAVVVPNSAIHGSSRSKPRVTTPSVGLETHTPSGTDEALICSPSHNG
jgi:hypothetical protein